VIGAAFSAGPNVALIQVGGTCTMNPKEAAEAVSMINPRKAIPMHGSDIVGERADAEELERLASCEVEILAS
jgi:L-ascorbate metabolism protein UlaG (beta-lactamase superfamily)